MIDVSLTVMARILSGKSDASVQDDLIDNGFPSDGIHSLFSVLAKLSDEDKNNLRYSCLLSEMKRDHWHRLRFNNELKTVMDRDYLLGGVALTRIEILAHKAGQEETDVTYSLELGIPELQRLIKGLEEVEKLLRLAEKELKTKVGDSVVVFTGV